MLQTATRTARRPMTTLADLWLATPRASAEENNIPFPQADDLEKVIALVRLADERPSISIQEITEAFGFTTRQANYYASAAMFIGAFIRYAPGCFKTTSVGRDIARMPNERATARYLAKRVLSSPAFHDNARRRIEVKTSGQRRKPIQARINDTTSARRMKTVSAWLERIEEML